MQTNQTNTIYVDGEPRHFGKDAQALMALAKTLYSDRDSELLVCCPEAPDGSGRGVWMRYDRDAEAWKVLSREHSANPGERRTDM